MSVDSNWDIIRKSQRLKDGKNPFSSRSILKRDVGYQKLYKLAKTKSEVPYRCFSIDCEMVGVASLDSEATELESHVARLSIVDVTGKVVFDKHIAPTKKVVDYRTSVSGIRPADLIDAPTLPKVFTEICDILKDAIIVGHDLYHDFDSFPQPYKLDQPTTMYLIASTDSGEESKKNFIQTNRDFDKQLSKKATSLDSLVSNSCIVIPRTLVRDTAHFHAYTREDGLPQKLKDLTYEYLDATIQEGSHDSVSDARASMGLYLRVRRDWERFLGRKRGMLGKRSVKEMDVVKDIQQRASEKPSEIIRMKEEAENPRDSRFQPRSLKEVAETLVEEVEEGTLVEEVEEGTLVEDQEVEISVEDPEVEEGTLVEDPKEVEVETLVEEVEEGTLVEDQEVEISVEDQEGWGMDRTRDFGRPERSGRDFGGRSGGRDFGGRSGGRDFGGRPGGRDFGGRPGGRGRDFGGRPERSGSRDFGGRSGGRDFGGRSGGRDFGGRPGGRDFGGRPGGRGRDFGGRPERSGSRDFGGRPGGRDSS
ncbi:hypothetical protein ADUPG1_013765, partial [Aduncisulcus paluster]